LLASVGLVALTATATGSASAAPPPPVPAWSWSGFYVGAHGGYGWGRDPFTDAVFGNKSPPITDVSSKGFLGGFQAGANWQAGSWVGGLELDLSATSIKGTSATTTAVTQLGLTTLVETAAQTDKFDMVGSARARLGYLPWPNVLLYGTAGPAWTRLVQTLDDAATLSQPGLGIETITESISNPSWRLGAVAGVGAEVRLGDTNWLGRVEYLHYDFGKSDAFLSSSSPSISTSGNLTLDVVRAGLGYKFGQAAGAGGSDAMAMSVKAPRATAAPWTWSGFYIGGHVGYGWAHDPFTEPNEGFDGNITLTGVQSNGFVGGFQAGANWQRGAWVGGLEADLSGSGIKGSRSQTVTLNDPGLTGTDTLTVTDKFELLGSARARIGYLAWPDVLLYGTGGLAWTRMVQNTDETTTITAGGTSSASSDSEVSWEFGWVAGVGVETRLWNTNWLARIEYLHYDFGDSGSNFNSAGVTFSSGHLTADVVRGGLSYKFDWSAGRPASAVIAMPVKARPAFAASDWSGFYLGGHVGYGWGRDPSSLVNVISGNIPSPFGDQISRTDLNASGLLAGFQAGANRQIGAFVGGLEIDLSVTGIKGSTTSLDTDADLTETNTDKFDMLGSARARLGYLALPNVLLYGTGGLAWTRLNKSITDVTTSVSGSTFPSWEFGWVAGAGGETKLWDSNWFWRVEYLHYDFGDSGNSSATENLSTILFSGSASTASLTGHLTADVVRTALSFKFN
jgi:outer membrane immunogenic protein